MTDQRLYIDGELVDLSEDTKFTLSIKSNLFREISDIVSNNTYTVKLPKTVRNQRILGHSDLVQNGGGTFPYKYHTAQYFRNGVQLIRNGRAAVMSVGEDFEISIVWGINLQLEDIIENNLKINELSNDAHIQYLPVNYPEDYDTAMQRGYYYADYNPFIATNNYDWATFSAVDHPVQSKTIALEDGAVETPSIWGTVRFYIDKTVTGYKCAIIRVGMGDNLLISNAVGSSQYKLWTCIDNEGKVLFQSNASEAIQPTVVTPSGSMDVTYIIVNIDTTASPNAEVVLRTRNSGFASSGGSNRFPQSRYQGTLPCVNLSWIFDQITSDTGILFQWPNEATDLINSLSIPLLQKDSDTTTYNDMMVEIVIQNSAALGSQSFLVREGGIFFDETASFVNSIQAKTSGKIYFSANAHWTWNAENAEPNTPAHGGGYSFYNFPNCYLIMKIQHRDDTTDEYTIGTNDFISAREEQVQSNLIRVSEYASGTIEIQEYDTITFELHNDYGTPTDLFYDFSLLGVADDDQEVPKGGLFPIIMNLPEVEIVDLLKFLCVITGTFPKQVDSGNVVSFAVINSIWDNIPQSVDWTRKLLTERRESKPSEMEFTIEDYAQSNYYRWKQDDTVRGYYDGSLRIANETLDVTKDVFEFPFAASDGNVIPLTSGDRNQAGVTVTSNQNGLTSTRADSPTNCEPRIMVASKNDDGEVALRFDISLQDILDTKYKNLAATLSAAKVVKETFTLSDIEIMEFDETKPVYLSQYGAYFAVAEIQVNEDGTSDVTMFQLVKVD